MTADSDPASRRAFVTEVGRFAAALPLAAGIAGQRGPAGDRHHLTSSASPSAKSPGDWDLSWIDRLAHATDRAVFDWGTMGDPIDPIVLALAARYLDNCEAVYGAKGFRPGVVLNIRTTATSAALDDAAWKRYGLGTDTKVNEPGTEQPAVRNPFWRRPAGEPPPPLPTLESLIGRGTIVLVCDFALGHMANRLATRVGRPADEVHADLRASFIPTAIAVPSGIFGLARSQNAGCGLVRM